MRNLGIGFNAGVTFGGYTGAGAGGFTGPQVFINSVTGSDDNPGTEELPLQTLSAIPFENGMRINLARGSKWREQLGQEGIEYTGITVQAYGEEGPLPVIDASEI